MMSRQGFLMVCMALCASMTGLAFVPVMQKAAVAGPRLGAASQQANASGTSSGESSRSTMIAGLVIGAHVGLALSLRSIACRAEGKYTESAQDAKLFETVFTQYTAEYLKGPMYETPEKMIGRRPFNPGEPLWGEDKKLTSNVLGPFKRVSSNELAFITMICLAIGAWGEAQFLWFDPQFAAIERGEFFNPIYIIAASLLPVSFWAHIACYIQKANGK
mmetsp:Transcript_42625/g.77439  ORF Transcript_42625/g.77439 Transcript_42625/m.77439 type:complete len:218 (-) Transcript_42625:66-719(-)